MTQEINLTPTCSFFEIAQGNKNIACRSWGTLSDCHAAVLAVHGLGAHSGWFEALGRRLKTKGIYTVAFDQLGFGTRQKEHLASYTEWLNDLKSVFAEIAKQVSNKPLFLAGNSMGGIVAAACAKDINPSGLVLFSPGFDGNPATFKLNFRIEGILKAIFTPNAEISLPYSPELVSINQNARTFMQNDPHRRFQVPAKMLLELLKLTQAVHKQSDNYKCPVLMFTAGKDYIVSNKINKQFFERLKTKDKKHIHLPQAFHDLMFDPAIDEVTTEIAQWIKSQKLIITTN